MDAMARVYGIRGSSITVGGGNGPLKGWVNVVMPLCAFEDVIKELNPQCQIRLRRWRKCISSIVTPYIYTYLAIQTLQRLQMGDEELNNVSPSGLQTRRY